MGFGEERRHRSRRDPRAIVLLDDVRSRKRAARYLPLWIAMAGFVATLAVLYSAPGFVDEMPAGIDGFIRRATTVVDRSLPLDKAGAYFSQCYTGGGTNCVVDGDTFWFGGVNIRISDIDAPETHPPRCSYEAVLGARATDRLQALLNAGTFELRVGSREEDIYGRKLRIVIRDGRSLGMRLVSEGLARKWDGARHPWC